ETRFPSARKLRAAGPYHWGRIACRIPQAKATCDTRWKTWSVVLLEAFAAELPSAECAATSAPFAAAVANREQLPDQIPLAPEDVHSREGHKIAFWCGPVLQMHLRLLGIENGRKEQQQNQFGKSALHVASRRRRVASLEMI